MGMMLAVYFLSRQKREVAHIGSLHRAWWRIVLVHSAVGDEEALGRHSTRRRLLLRRRLQAAKASGFRTPNAPAAAEG